MFVSKSISTCTYLSRFATYKSSSDIQTCHSIMKRFTMAVDVSPEVPRRKIRRFNI